MPLSPLLPDRPTALGATLPEHLMPGVNMALYQGTGTIATSTGPRRVPVTVIWNLTAGKGTAVRAAEGEADHTFSTGWTTRLTLEPFPETTLYVSHPQPPIQAVGGAFVTPPATVTRMQFHLVNAREFRDPLVFTADGWTATIENLPEPEKRAAFFARGGRTAVTQWGQLSREDGAPFQSDDRSVEAFIDALTWTLTFANGKMAVPSVLSGFNVDDERVFLDITAPDPGQAGDVHHWCTRWFGANVTEIFPALYARLQDPEYGDELRIPIHFYADAHAPRITTSTRLIAMQAALERLYIYWDKRMRPTLPTPPPAPAGGAGEKFSAMLGTMGIDTALPAETPGLRALAAAAPRGLPSPASGPALAVFIRNHLTHNKGTPAAQAIAGVD